MSAENRDPASVDVILVNYLSGAVLSRCVSVLVAFLPDDARFIFVDNSPNDGAVAAASALVERSTVLTQRTNVGFAAAVNAGLGAGNAPIVLLANPDVASVSGRFADVLEVFENHRRAGAMTGKLVDDRSVLMHCRRAPTLVDFLELAVGFNRLLPRRWRRPSVAMLEWAHDSLREVETVTGAFLFIRRAAIDDVGPFDERFFLYWEETDWMVRARRLGWSTYFSPKLEVVHLGQASAPSSAGHTALFIESLYEYVKKHHGVPKLLLLRAVWTAADGLRLVRSSFWRRGDPIEIRARLGSHLKRRLRPDG